MEVGDLVTLNSWRGNRALRNDTHGFRFPVSMEMDRAWYDANVVKAPPTKALFAIQNDAGGLAGIAQLDRIDPIHRHAALGIYIGNPQERGKGLGKSAMNEILKFGFDDLNLRKIYVHVNKSNADACRLYEKLGFVKEGDMRSHYFIDGRWDDVLIMAMFKQDHAM
ncbi:GNAT family N-acetyltransferase [Oceaniradius stylonematis]|uniref:GNAT family N-acetyltransferase n=1 Tax=Oceaniradius stylonematis TaxID=2184161 RepID=UPI0035CFD07A